MASPQHSVKRVIVCLVPGGVKVHCWNQGSPSPHVPPPSRCCCRLFLISVCTGSTDGTDGADQALFERLELTQPTPALCVVCRKGAGHRTDGTDQAVFERRGSTQPIPALCIVCRRGRVIRRTGRIRLSLNVECRRSQYPRSTLFAAGG